MRQGLRRSSASLIEAWKASWGWAISLSRHGVLAAERLAPGPATKATGQQMLSLVAGSSLIGLGVAFFVHGNLGLAPYDVFLSVLRDRIGLTLGQSAWLVSGVLFTIAAVLGQRARPASLVYVFLNGLAVDAALNLIRDPQPLYLRVGFVVFGMVTVITGISLVVHSGLTGGSFELLMRAGAERGYDPIKVRTCLEVGIFAAGVALGGDIGAATVLYALAVGPLMRAIRQAMDDHRSGRAARLEGDIADEAHHAPA